jgi:hypothetical protein
VSECISHFVLDILGLLDIFQMAQDRQSERTGVEPCNLFAANDWMTKIAL